MFLDNVMDPESYIWEAQPLKKLPTSNIMHFYLRLGAVNGLVPLDEHSGFNSGPLSILAKSSSTLSQTTT